MGAQALEGFKEIKNLHVLIMAGGSGTRFWPKSRMKKPKQLLALWDDKTLIEHTVRRFANVAPQENIWIITHQGLIEPSQKVLNKEFPKIRYLSEPVGKNTAPCILWGTHEIQKVCPDAVIAVMSADAYIGNEEAFLDALKTAILCARETKSLVTLGVRPNRPETGYGYIEVERGATGPKGRNTLQAVRVCQFVEKPDLKTAVRYLESGNYLWNAGMFIFTADSGLSAFQKTMPSLVELFSTSAPVDTIYPKISKGDAVSVDYGVMEEAINKGIPVSVVPMDCDWNDVGSFTALEEINCTTRGEVVSLDAVCNIVQADQGIVAILGVNDLVVVRDGDVVLVTSKDRAQDIKLLVDKVRVSHPDMI